jgi:hypothetical protein
MRPTKPLPGAPLLLFAVATLRVKPIARLRPPRPAGVKLKPKDRVPGAPFLRGD